MVTMKDLLECGVHFGHQTRRWNPKMKKYIFGVRKNIYIIDLQKTLRYFRNTYQIVVDAAAEGKTILFVGTKKQDQLVDISKQIFSLRNAINTLQNNLSSQYIQEAQILGQINLSHKPVKPKKALIIIVAFITGMILSIFLVFFLEFLIGIKEEDR